MRRELADFLDYCRLERRLAPLTCSAYERDVGTCIAFLEREGIVMTGQGTGTFVSEGARRTLAPAERQSKLDSLCSEFLAQAARYGFSPDEVVRAIRTLTERRKQHG